MREIQVQIGQYIARPNFELEVQSVLDINVVEQYDRSRRLALESTKNERNGVEYTEFSLKIEEKGFTVSKIGNISLIGADEKGYFGIRFSDVTLIDGFSKESKVNMRKDLKDLRIKKYKMRLEELIPFYHQNQIATELEYYKTLVPIEYHRIEIDLAPQIWDTFGIREEHKIYSLCPFTLIVYDSEDNQCEIGPLSDWMRLKPKSTDIPHASNILNRFNRLNKKWKAELRDYAYGTEDLFERYQEGLEQSIRQDQYDEYWELREMILKDYELEKISEEELQQLSEIEFQGNSDMDLGAWDDESTEVDYDGGDY